VTDEAIEKEEKQDWRMTYYPGEVSPASFPTEHQLTLRQPCRERGKQGEIITH